MIWIFLIGVLCSLVKGQNPEFRLNNGFDVPLSDDVINGDETPGIAGLDYPVYSRLPRTSFRCDKVGYPGYYADPESRCQAFYICLRGGKGFGFLCPNGTVFSQEVLVCDWWNNVQCDRATQYYDGNRKIFNEMNLANQKLGIPTIDLPFGAGAGNFPSTIGNNLNDEFPDIGTGPNQFEGDNQGFQGTGGSGFGSGQGGSGSGFGNQGSGFGSGQGGSGPGFGNQGSGFGNQGGSSPFGDRNPIGQRPGQGQRPGSNQQGRPGGGFNNFNQGRPGNDQFSNQQGRPGVGGNQFPGQQGGGGPFRPGGSTTSNPFDEFGRPGQGSTSSRPGFGGTGRPGSSTSNPFDEFGRPGTGTSSRPGFGRPTQDPNTGILTSDINRPGGGFGRPGLGSNQQGGFVQPGGNRPGGNNQQGNYGRPGQNQNQFGRPDDNQNFRPDLFGSGQDPGNQYAGYPQNQYGPSSSQTGGRPNTDLESPGGSGGGQHGSPRGRKLFLRTE